MATERKRKRRKFPKQRAFNPKIHIFNEDAADQYGYTNYNSFLKTTRELGIQRWRSGFRVFYLKSEIDAIAKKYPNIGKRLQVTNGTQNGHVEASNGRRPRSKSGATVVVGVNQLRKLIRSGVELNIVVK